MAGSSSAARPRERTANTTASTVAFDVRRLAWVAYFMPSSVERDFRRHQAAQPHKSGRVDRRRSAMGCTSFAVGFLAGIIERHHCERSR